MAGLLRDRRRTSSGILYGIDAENWNPANDALLPYTYGPDDQHLGRASNKIRLLESLELPVEPDVPLFTCLSPLDDGQGLDLLRTVVGDLMGERLKIVKMNIDENPGAPGRYGVRAIPTLLAFQGGQVVEQMQGARPKSALEEMVQKLV